MESLSTSSPLGITGRRLFKFRDVICSAVVAISSICRSFANDADKPARDTWRKVLFDFRRNITGRGLIHIANPTFTDGLCILSKRIAEISFQEFFESEVDEAAE